jgi:hypothetical protein
MRTEADQVLQVIAKALFDDGYLKSGETMREVALAFLRATVEDVNKSMAERMQAAQTLLMHSTPG